MAYTPDPRLRLHTPLREVLFSIGVFYMMMFLPLIGTALFLNDGNWWPWPTLLFIAMLMTSLTLSLEHIVLFNRLKLSRIRYDGSFDVDGSLFHSDTLTSIEEVVLDPGFKATKYHFLLLRFESNNAPFHALCLVRDGWIMKDIMTNQSRSLRLLLQRSPELKSKLLPRRLIKRRSEILHAT